VEEEPAEVGEMKYIDHGLCFRCEYRARFCETGERPRMECGDIDSAVNSCYMAKPVKPIVVSKDHQDRRPLMPGLFSARFHRVADPIVELCIKQMPRGYMLYWMPKEKERGTPD
jgi:hypothetical protein